MCAIIDANIAHEVFGDKRPEAGEEFFKWLLKGKGRLVAGSKLLEELKRTKYRRWARQAIFYAGIFRPVIGDEVNAKTKELEQRKRKIKDTYKSDDPHILALAQVSGARLLYSNDGDLQEDFGNKDLIDNPRGKVYSTRHSKNFQRSHRGLLNNRDLCRPPK